MSLNKPLSRSGVPLTLGPLMRCYDRCTEHYLDRTLGHDSDLLTAGCDGGDIGGANDACRYGFLQQYRNVFHDSKVRRIYFFHARHFSISDNDALVHLDKDELVFLPIAEPDTQRRHLLSPGVVNKIFLLMYNHLLQFLWQHLRSFEGAENATAAAIISFQNVDELNEMKERFSAVCSGLEKTAGDTVIYIGIKENLLKSLEKYVVRGG